MMRKILLFLIIMGFTFACNNPYENVKGDEIYSGAPVLRPSSEEASINLESMNGNNSDKAKLFVDSLVLSHTLDVDLHIVLELVKDETLGEIGKNFIFQENVVIKAGEYYGKYEVEAIDVPQSDAGDYALSVQIKKVISSVNVAIMYGLQIEGEEREKLYKTYSFR